MADDNPINAIKYVGYLGLFCIYYDNYWTLNLGEIKQPDRPNKNDGMNDNTPY